MLTQISISLVVREGSLVRLLGLIERRGFIISALDMPPKTDFAEGDLMQLRMDVQSRDAARTSDGLLRQISKLVDVETASLVDLPLKAQAS